MKNLILSAIMMAFVCTACDTNKTSETTTTSSTHTENAQKYACSMHPEVTGNKGEKCSKCGMELTVAVPAAGSTAPAEVVYACSMHPEVQGKKGDKCSKCGMTLDVEVK